MTPFGRSGSSLILARACRSARSPRPSKRVPDAAPPVRDLLRLAEIALRAEDLCTAERFYRLALDTDADNPTAHHNLANTFAVGGRWLDAEMHYRRAADLVPGAHEPRHGLSHALMAQGRYQDAQPYLASRHGVPKLKIPPVAYQGAPPWSGEDLAGKKLLIFPEQGLGDQIMMARFIPRLTAAGADVTLLCSPPLVDIFSSLGVRVLAATGAVEFPRPHFWTTVMDLPGLMGLHGDMVSSAPYVRAPDHPPLGPGFHVGIATQGNPGHANDAARSLRQPDSDRLWALPAMVHSLAREEGRDLTAVAALIGRLDLVISVDSAVAHLAAALGKPVWVLVPSIRPDWRWGLKPTESTPWLPMARLFWSAPDGSWGETIDRMRAELVSLQHVATPLDH